MVYFIVIKLSINTLTIIGLARQGKTILEGVNVPSVLQPDSPFLSTITGASFAPNVVEKLQPGRIHRQFDITLRTPEKNPFEECITPGNLFACPVSEGTPSLFSETRRFPETRRESFLRFVLL